MVLPQPSHGFFWTQEPWGAALKSAALLAVAPHLFTSASVSVSRDLRDPALAAVAASLGLAADTIVQARQVHGRAVVGVRPENAPVVVPDPTTGAFSGLTPTAADALISDDPARGVAVRVADCAPILIADRRTGAVAAVHAGWRGTAAGVVGAAIDAMRREFGTRAADLIAAIGPSIRSCCYEVGPELRTAFADSGHDAHAIDRWFTRGRGDRWQLDVVRANRDQLEASGVAADQIHDSGLCTLCQNDAASSHDATRASNTLSIARPRGEANALHSYRRHGSPAGRMLAAIRRKTSQP